MRAINADHVSAFVDKFDEFAKQTNKYMTAKVLRYAMEKFPVIEAEPVRYGRWEPIEYDRHRCTCCGGTEDYWWADKGTPYCPWCGVKMNAEDEEYNTN